MADVEIWHNPRCGKSRTTLQLLQDKGIEPKVVLYLENIPSAARIKKALGLLGVQARGLMRTKETLYKDLGLSDPKLTEAALIKAMVENPILIERPLVWANGKAALGRPPEAVQDIL